MDFEYRYTSDQELFRKEVNDWLDANVPEGMKPHFASDAAHMDKETFRWAKEFRQKFGEKGWLFPTWLKEYGGGGLSYEENKILQEQLEELIQYSSTDYYSATPVIMLIIIGSLIAWFAMNQNNDALDKENA